MKPENYSAKKGNFGHRIGLPKQWLIMCLLIIRAAHYLTLRVGAGAFFRAAKTIAKEKGFSVNLSGMDIDPLALEQAIEQGLNGSDIAGVKIGDFIFEHPPEKQSAIVANPPYIRHHRLLAETKERLKRLSLQTLGTALDGARFTRLFSDSRSDLAQRQWTSGFYYARRYL
ncbi:MAG: hypothetical protein HC889_04870 [Synechococcaceae cyanobacterium SM1_2_3]|nr:hypothetical protein [Synechococcaceae cyanobacterium SM1_2_3]